MAGYAGPDPLRTRLPRTARPCTSEEQRIKSRRIATLAPGGSRGGVARAHRLQAPVPPTSRKAGETTIQPLIFQLLMQ